MDCTKGTTQDVAMRIVSPGHVAFALIMIALEILGIINGNFAAIWQPVPKALPGREILVYLCAIISLVCGLGLLWRRPAVFGACVLLIYFLLWLLLLRTPGMFTSFTVDVWWAWCKTAVMVAGAWILYSWLATEWDTKHFSFAIGDNGLRIARILYGVVLIPFGVAHFIYLNATAPLVPNWLPWHVGWAYFTGSAFIAGGVAISTGVRARLAAALVALQMGLFTLLVWIPIVATKANAFQWSEFVVSCALVAGGWVIAESYRDIPRLAVGTRRNAT